MSWCEEGFNWTMSNPVCRAERGTEYYGLETARTETQDYLGRYRTTVAQLAEKLHAEPFSSEMNRTQTHRLDEPSW